MSDVVKYGMVDNIPTTDGVVFIQDAIITDKKYSHRIKNPGFLKHLPYGRIVKIFLGPNNEVTRLISLKV